MTAVLLDIGAGSTYFARRFRRLNHGLWNLMYLCGEPKYRGVWNGKARRNGILKIAASYASFGVPDQSLAIVTMNAFHPLMPYGGIESELERCLQSGGLFISAHPIGWHPKLNGKVFGKIEFPHQDGNVLQALDFEDYRRGIVPFQVLGGPILKYPPSRTIKNRLNVLAYYGVFGQSGSGYIYSGMNGTPSLEIWIRK